MIWLASWPRSGNTFLRTILWNCFRLKSASVYPQDLGDNRSLALQIGHVEHDAINKSSFMPGDPILVKTHEHPVDNKPAVYVVRDGRPACVSLWKFYNKSDPLSVIISGRHRFGTWANHVKAWNPEERSNTLLLKYEDMIAHLSVTIDKIGLFLNREPLSYDIPPRDHIAGLGGRHVNTYSDWKEILTGADLQLFWEKNGDMMEKMYGITE
jgi:hypothetical protein